LTGSGGVKIEIKLVPQQQQQQQLHIEQQQQQPVPLGPRSNEIIPMDHYPSWKLHKNPFWRVKHPSGTKMAAVAPNSFSGELEVKSQLFAYEAHQDVGGFVTLHVAPGKKIEHLGIKVQFIGRIDMVSRDTGTYIIWVICNAAHSHASLIILVVRSGQGFGVNEGRPHYDFISLSKELMPPGTLYQNISELPFLFRNMDKEHESYRGRNVSVRYFVKVVLDRKFLPPLQKEHDVWVQMLGQPPQNNQAIKMEVGIEDCLHIEFEYERRVYHMQDTILGKIHFLLVRIKIKHMELAVIRRETSGDGMIATNNGGAGAAPSTDAQQNVSTETQTLLKYEIMDGAPVKGEVIPVKLSLRGIPADLTPTYTNVNNRFSVRYFLNLVLVDEEDRRYFKQQEIILWRKELG
jgi:vacuolar protein sorting-associated protein 26